MSFSDWLKLDLHIHSIESNKFKQNDYKGEAYDINELKTVLTREGINVFSITDHNCINKDLYKDLIKNRDELREANLNFVVGCELDIHDTEIYDQIFHCLVFFDTEDIKKIDKILKQLVYKEDDEYKYPDLREVFSKFAYHEVKDFILIPHFNNKGKGLKDRDMHIKAVDCLERSVFNAYEDTNNIDKIKESFNIYTEVGHPDLPVLVFSDCHDISVYPKQNQEDTNENPTFLKMLGNLNYPFESLKLAFQDARMRMGSDLTDYFRGVSLPHDRQYIKSIKINDTKINLSPYQNTVIGGFGSGKSFLLNLINHGKDGFPEKIRTKYNDLLETINEFEVITSDGIVRSSLSELESKAEVIQFEQNEGLFFKDVLDEEEKRHLEEKLKIEFPLLEPISEHDFSNIIDKYDEVDTLVNRNITDEINYGHLFSSDNHYTIEEEALDRDISEKKSVNNLVSILRDEKESSILDVSLYGEKEKEQISEVIKLIEHKNLLWNKNYNLYMEFSKNSDVIIGKFNDEQLKNNRKLKANREVKDGIIKYLNQLIDKVTNLKKECKYIEETLSTKQYDNYKKQSRENNPGSYSLITKYKTTNSHENVVNALFSLNNQKSSLFQSLLNKCYNGLSFRQNRTDLKECLNKYYEETFYNNFSEYKYDIQKDGESIMKKSAGEKASMIIDIIFEIIRTNYSKDKQTILIIDQPEDHLDNDNIEVGIVKKIREMKKKNTIPQIIFVSHNANISISADSENIIIANKTGDSCSYKGSGIESPKFIDEVCTILEGGRNALITRGMKFSVSYSKTY